MAINKVAEFAYDLHSGLSAHRISEFDDLHTIGMAATLAIHIKGLGEIQYDTLRKVSDHFMNVPSVALERVLRVLSEVGFVKLIENGKKIQTIIPNIPVFENVYSGIETYAASECDFNEHEQAIVEILASLQDSPQNRDGLFNKLGIQKPLFDRCITISKESGILNEHQARGRPILISPFYFADNLTTLADAAAASGANAIKSVLKKVKDNQGWPLSLIATTAEIGGTRLPPEELAIVQKLAEEGVVKPPTIKFGTKSESFIFTPKPGGTRLNAANREIYERAMALVSAVRKGQLLPDAYQIRSPVRILEALRDRGYLRSNSEAKEQYHNLVILRVASLKRIGYGWQLHLIDSPENKRALDVAINLLRTGALANMEVDQEARIALTKGEEYIQSLISASDLRKRQKQIKNEQAEQEFEQLLLKF